ncbi:MAG: hypothetical protein IPL28_09145 [Chloroflexi bacterium]|nr:hypothetical protein [Chloroflexota bacterium]
MPVNGVSGYALYATYDPNTADYLFAVRAPVAIGATTTLWLNTDQNPATGYQVSGFAGGAEFNINIFGDGQPYLYTGADGQIFTFGLSATPIMRATPLWKWPCPPPNWGD